MPCGLYREVDQLTDTDLLYGHSCDRRFKDKQTTGSQIHYIVRETLYQYSLSLKRSYPMRRHETAVHLKQYSSQINDKSDCDGTE